MSLCSEKYIEPEIDFLVNVFIENGYKEEELLKIVRQVKLKRNEEQSANIDTDPTQTSQTITLPWIPGISPKLKKIYKKAGYKIVFKSGPNLQSILTSKNKTKLPKNSFPGVYKIPCSCGTTPYRGETKKRVCTRIKEHEQYMKKEQGENSGAAGHALTCKGKMIFENAETVKVIYNRFDRKVRESLEIQRHNCHVKNGGMNPDKGQYVKTNFWIPYLHHLNKCEGQR